MIFFFTFLLVQQFTCKYFFVFKSSSKLKEHILDSNTYLLIKIGTITINMFTRKNKFVYSCSIKKSILQNLKNIFCTILVVGAFPPKCCSDIWRSRGQVLGCQEATLSLSSSQSVGCVAGSRLLWRTGPLCWAMPTVGVAVYLS